MKKIKILLVCLFLISCHENVVDNNDERIIEIPDNIFKQKIIAAGYDTNNDNEISQAEARLIDSLYVAEPDPTLSNPKIKDLTGIQEFINLKYFNCYQNNISGEIDFSNNVNLIKLNIGVNGISHIVLDKLDKLEDLDILGNSISALDISTNINLKKLNLSLNKLTELDLSKNINLEELKFLGNNFSNIDFSNNHKLKILGISGAHHNINNLDLSNCTELEILSVSYIDIRILDISNNRKLQSITLAFLDKLEKICVWELPLPENIKIGLTNINAQFEVCN